MGSRGQAGVTAQKRPGPRALPGLFRGPGIPPPSPKVGAPESPPVAPSRPPCEEAERTKGASRGGGQREETKSALFWAVPQPGNSLLAPSLLHTSLLGFLSGHKLCARLRTSERPPELVLPWHILNPEGGPGQTQLPAQTEDQEHGSCARCALPRRVGFSPASALLRPAGPGWTLTTLPRSGQDSRLRMYHTVHAP